jgi:hypothetical protein
MLQRQRCRQPADPGPDDRDRAVKIKGHSAPLPSTDEPQTAAGPQRELLTGFSR